MVIAVLLRSEAFTGNRRRAFNNITESSPLETTLSTIGSDDGVQSSLVTSSPQSFTNFLQQLPVYSNKNFRNLKSKRTDSKEMDFCAPASTFLRISDSGTGKDHSLEIYENTFFRNPSSRWSIEDDGMIAAPKEPFKPEPTNKFSGQGSNGNMVLDRNHDAEFKLVRENQLRQEITGYERVHGNLDSERHTAMRALGGPELLEPPPLVSSDAPKGKGFVDYGLVPIAGYH